MKQKRKVNKPNQEDLLFITDIPLRKKIIAAIETISGLYLVEQNNKYPAELIKEIRRIIVLYAASIIEAILLYLYIKEKDISSKVDYTDVHILPSSFQKDPSFKMVVAKQIQVPRAERELMLDVLLKIYSEKKIISTSLEQKIKKAKDIRNTFHLSKSRVGLPVSLKVVQLSTEAIYETIVSVKNNLVK